MTPTSTVLIGVAVFVVSQYALKLVLEPVARVRRTIADVASTVLFRQRKITNANPDEGASEELRKAAAQLLASVHEVQWYGLIAGLGVFGVPPKGRVLEACGLLNLLAYGVQESEVRRSALANVAALEKLGKLLRVPTTYENPNSDRS